MASKGCGKSRESRFLAVFTAQARLRTTRNDNFKVLSGSAWSRALSKRSALWVSSTRRDML